MGCCTLRTLSLISASVQLAGSILAIIIFGFLGAVVSNDEVQAKLHETEEGEMASKAATFVIVIYVVAAAISVAILVTLIVGIKQNRVKLVKIYVYFQYVGYVLVAIGCVLGFIMGFVNSQPVGTIFKELFLRILYTAFSMLFFAPIFMLYRKMIEPPIQPEQQGLNTNYQLNKPNYAP